MKKIALCAMLLVLTGCASQLDIRDGDCSVTFVEVDARAATPVVGGVEADGWVMVVRGECTKEMIQLYRDMFFGVDGNTNNSGVRRQ